MGLIPLSGWFPKDRQALHLMTADELRELVRLAGDYAIQAAAVGDAYGKQVAAERRNLAELAYRAKVCEVEAFRVRKRRCGHAANETCPTCYPLLRD